MTGISNVERVAQIAARVPRLTAAGRAYAEQRPDSLVCKVALAGYSSDWPAAYVAVAIRTCNHAAA